jgi:hypothetical protein
MSLQPAGLHPDLVRRPKVDSQRGGAATDIDAERLPQKRLLNNPLAQIAGKEALNDEDVVFSAQARRQVLLLQHSKAANDFADLRDKIQNRRSILLVMLLVLMNLAVNNFGLNNSCRTLPL